MKKLALLLGAFFLAAPLLCADQALTEKSLPGFEKLKSLVGEWTTRTKEGKPVEVSYRMVSNGTALMEMLSMEKHAGDMVTMYHPDGNNLMMTHYCSANNQPRMKAEPASGAIKSLTFNFVDATNLNSPDAGHMHRLVITFLDKDHFNQEWTWREKGKDVHEEVFQFERKK